ncbi:MAG: hypothetical protein UW68_C0026G0016 [Candidatus Collierbacteria bacterium GW2011_GWB1_44_6]|uniref:Prohead serine protease domain-containing protein n=1 Tax=Candidatus Collierbacteria bacterium GW2011_GWB1_44_6 TaxID=1618384 RepID=A0A0G1LVD6_9BACT|nr:MAG: hypothetical protein UW68_C0026G0016 [Candidatus Collierbacteria bacterium GW2011_GWB1_44_6]
MHIRLIASPEGSQLFIHMKKRQKLYQIMPVLIKGVDDAKHTLEAVFSTNDEDRHGDVVEQNWDLKSFKKNPVILNSHNYYDATEVIGKATGVSVKDGKLEGTIEFAVGANPKADIIYKLYAGGFLNAFSVGFIAKEFDDKGTILKGELLEVSAVSVPANAMALAKAKGIEIEKLYELPITKSDEHDGGEEDEGDNDDEEGNGDNANGAGGSGEGGQPAGDGKPAEGVKTEDAKVDEKNDEVEEQKKLDALDAEEIAKKKLAVNQTFNKIAKVIDSFCENIKAETSLLGSVAVEKSNINRAIRQLIKIKKAK